MAPTAVSIRALAPVTGYRVAHRGFQSRGREHLRRQLELLFQNRRQQDAVGAAAQGDLSACGVCLAAAEGRRVPPADSVAQLALVAAQGLQGVSGPHQRLEFGAGTNPELRLHDGHQRRVLLAQRGRRGVLFEIVGRGVKGCLDPLIAQHGDDPRQTHRRQRIGLVVADLRQLRQQHVEPVGDFPLPLDQRCGLGAGQVLVGVHRRDVQRLLLDEHLVQLRSEDFRGVLDAEAEHDAADLAGGQVDEPLGLDQVLAAVRSGRRLAQLLSRRVHVLVADELDAFGDAVQLRPGGILQHPVGLQIAHQALDAHGKLLEPLADEVLSDGFENRGLGVRLAGADAGGRARRGRRHGAQQPQQPSPTAPVAAPNGLPPRATGHPETSVWAASGASSARRRREDATNRLDWRSSSRRAGWHTCRVPAGETGSGMRASHRSVLRGARALRRDRPMPSCL
jgi:hypothetical protein